MEGNNVLQDMERVVSRIKEIRKKLGYRKELYYPSFEDTYNKAIKKDNKSVSKTNTKINSASDKIGKVEKESVEGYDKDKIIKKASEKYKIPEELIRAVIKQESNFNEKAVSKKGAMGLMQLMPDTAKLLNVDNPFDIEENIFGGTEYLHNLINLYNGNLNKALAAYNAGPKRVNGNIPEIPETKNFIDNVIENYKRFSKFNDIE